MNEYKEKLKNMNIENILKSKSLKQATDFLCYTYMLKKNRALNELIKKKVFQLDFNSNNSFTIEIINFLFENHIELNINQEDLGYLISKRNLAIVFLKAKQLYTSLLEDIQSYGKSFIRDILFFIDIKKKISREIIEFNNTEIIEFNNTDNINTICSFLIHLYKTNTNKYSTDKNSFSNNINISYEPISKIITNGYLINFLIDIEKKVDSLKYLFDKNNKEYILYSINENFEKTITKGVDQTKSQLFFLANDINQNFTKFPSLKNFIDDYKKDYSNFFILKKDPLERYVLNVGKEFYELLEMILEIPFKDELIDFEILAKEFFINIDDKDIYEFKIYEEVNIKDIIKVQKVFKIIHFIKENFFMKLLKANQNNLQIIYNSCIIVFEEKTLIATITNFIDESKAKVFLDIFSSDIKQSEFVNLTYLPFIKVDTYYYISTELFSNSLLIRNAMFSQKIRPMGKFQYDHISDELYNILKKNFKFTAKEVKFNFKGSEHLEGDFDVLAFIEDTLFIFEIKNTLLPLNFHENLNIFNNNISKGIEQIKKCKKLINNIESMKYLNDTLNLNHNLNKTLKWKIPDNTKVVSCIVLGNRIFNGYTENNIRVFSSYELIHFLKTGNVLLKKIKNNQAEIIEERKLWEDDKITKNDLINYIEKGFFHEERLDEFDAYTESINIKNIKIKKVCYERKEILESLKKDEMYMKDKN